MRIIEPKFLLFDSVSLVVVNDSSESNFTVSTLDSGPID